MADGIHANYTKIGFAVVAGVAAIIGTLVYLGGAGGAQHTLLAETYYGNAVTGLSVGSDVNFRGVKVGEVRDISFVGSEYYDVAEEDMQKVYILLAFDTRKMRLDADEDPAELLRKLVGKGLHATVSSSGVTGLSKIELNFPVLSAEEPKISWKPEHICIPPQLSMLDSFADAASKFMNQINRMDFVSAWSNVASVAESAAKVAGNVDELVEREKSGLESIVHNLDESAVQIRELVSRVKDNPSLLIRNADPEPLAETSR